MMDDDTNRLEETLARSLAAMVDGQHPSPEQREQVADGILAAPQRNRRRFVPMAAAAAVLAIALLGAVIARDGRGDEMDVATDPTPTTTEAPQVLGDQVTRTPTETTTETTTDETDAEESGPTTTVPVATTLAPAPLPTAPPTTALVCHFSTDPACGPFYWDPAPVNQPATLTVTAPDDIVAGEQVSLAITMTDDGRVTLDCFVVDMSPDTGLYTGTCSYDPPDCPARYGPWTPVPQSGRASTNTVVSFDEPGTYQVTVRVQPAQGCDNVDPYRSGASTTITIEVGPAPEG
jgi:hypothetical protein